MKTNNNAFISILGDSIRAKLLNVFIENEDYIFSQNELEAPFKKYKKDVKYVLKDLEDEGIIRKKIFSAKKQKELKTKKGFSLNKKYKHIETLKMFLRETMPNERDNLIRKLSKIPAVSFFVIKDIYRTKLEKDVDILIATKTNKDKEIKAIIEDIEENMGKELSYIVLSVNELSYRLKTADKFINDILNDKYAVCVDKIDLI